MADMHHFTTSISRIVSTAQEEDTIIRGHRLSDLIRTQSFVSSAFLLLTGRLPTSGEARTLDAMMTACVDHGITPAAAIGRTFATYGTPVAQAIAGSVLLYGDVAGGVGDPLAAMMKAAIGDAVAQHGAVSEEIIDHAAGKLVMAALEAEGRVPGFGNPPHARDPRPAILLEVARTAGVAGVYCSMILAVERQLAMAKRREIPMNIDGIIAALALDLGLPDGCAAVIVMIARQYSVLMHYLEEKSQSIKWRHVPQHCVNYVGPMPA